MCRQPLTGNTRGATILDVVIVLVIVLIVAAVLFPILTPPHRDSARKSTCQSNLKECAIALQLYWRDYDTVLPSSAVANGRGKWDRREFLRFATEAGQLPPVGQPRTWTHYLYGHMKNKDIMFCPSDPSANSGAKGRVSYWWKLAIDKAWCGDGSWKPCKREADFAYNADQIVLYERGQFHHGGAGLTNGAQINAAFLDTHVRTIEITNATSGDPVNCAANRDGEPMYFNFDNTKPKQDGANPAPANTPARYIDPARYSDMTR